MLLQQAYRPPRVALRWRDQPASTSPVIWEGTGGNARCLRPIVHVPAGIGETLRDQPQRLTRDPKTGRDHLLRIDTPTEVSKTNNTRARRIIEAECTPVVVIRTNSSRSTSAKVTGRLFCGVMTNVPSGRGEGSASHQRSNQTHRNLSSDTPLGVLG